MPGSIFGVVKDLAEIAIAPVEIAADVTRAVTKPTADFVGEVVDEVKEVTKDLTDQEKHYE